jgi:hypothetical protein
MPDLELRYMTMENKIYLVLQALLLVVGMFALQGCFEEEYHGHGGGYAPAYGYNYGSPPYGYNYGSPPYGYRYESPWHEHEEEEREEHGERERD